MAVDSKIRNRFRPLKQRSFWSDIHRTATEDEILGLAAQLSFYLTFALFPGLLGILEILGRLELPALADVILTFLGGLLPKETVPLVTENLKQAAQTRLEGFVGLAVLAALASVLRAIYTIGRLLNRTARISEDRSWFKKFYEQLLAVAFMAAVLFGVAAVIATLRPYIRELDITAIWVVWVVARWLLWLVMFAIAVSFLYTLAPATKIRWRWIAPGPLLAAALWSSGSLVLRWAASELLRYDILYGSVGTMILLLMWIYWTSLVVLIGGHVEASAQGAMIGQEEATARNAARPAAAQQNRSQAKSAKSKKSQV